MGVCMCSASRRITAPLQVPPPVSVENASRLDPAIKRKLIDLKKVRMAPVLCLNNNLLYKRRSERHTGEVSGETMSSPNSLESQEKALRVPFLHTDLENC